jgi:hypothetical protein
LYLKTDIVGENGELTAPGATHSIRVVDILPP